MTRVKGKDLGDAALEINHWCHEKVSYQPADIRTSAPSVQFFQPEEDAEKNQHSRSLHSGQPEYRQDRYILPAGLTLMIIMHGLKSGLTGQWYYMGACEPEPVLDRGWFTEPARRAMLVHTKSFGAFSGNENINK